MVHQGHLRFGLLFAVALTAGCAVAAGTAPGDVKIDSENMVKLSLTGSAGDAAAGRDVYKGRKAGNCLACHANSDMASEQFHGEIGPAMDGVADRYTTGELRAILVNSKAVFGDQTIMPGFYRDHEPARTAKKFKGKTILTAEQVEDVIAYLKTLKE